MILLKIHDIYIIVESLEDMKMLKEMPYKSNRFGYINTVIDLIQWKGEEKQLMNVPEKYRERLTSSDEQLRYMTLEILIQDLNKKYDI